MRKNDFLELSIKFTGKYLYLSDGELFASPIKNEEGATLLPEFDNKMLEEEARAFLQDIIVNKHYTAESSKQYINHLCSLKLIVNTRKYSKLTSFTDISLSEFKKDLEKHLKSTRRINNNVRFYSWLYSHYYPKDDSKMYEYDVWELDKLPFRVTQGVSPMETLDFSSIQTPWLKDAFKKVAWRTLQTVGVLTVKNYIYAIVSFDQYLVQCNFQKGQPFTRDDAEKCLGFLRRKYSNASTFNHILSRIKIVLKVSRMLGMDYIPNPARFASSDNLRRPKPDPQPYSDREMERVIAHLDKLHGMDYELATIIIQHGFRIGDACGLLLHDDSGNLTLEKQNDGSYKLKVFMYKCRRWEVFPLRELTAQVLLKRVELSLRDYGEGCKYIFATGADSHANQETIRRHLRKWVKENNICSDCGELIDIGKTHRFRKTVGTTLAVVSNDPKAVSVFLGQNDTSSLIHYVHLSSTEMLGAMKEYRDDNDQAVKNIGRNINVFDDCMPKGNPSGKKILPLSNGYCRKPGGEICCHANACYKCPMFKPSKEYLRVYKYQLREAVMAKQHAVMMGYTTIVEHNQEIIDYLSKIIVQLEGETHDKRSQDD